MVVAWLDGAYVGFTASISSSALFRTTSRYLYVLPSQLLPISCGTSCMTNSPISRPSWRSGTRDEYAWYVRQARRRRYGEERRIGSTALGTCECDVWPAGDASVVSLSTHCNGQWQHARSGLVKRSDQSVGVVGAMSVVGVLRVVG
jgi:hypothetical protein